ncbi:hypothetical protein MVEN_01994900 [Mycena venus]|uniref:Uncharacterized protein n=1 Tax=Mycena venus TaxID=2733690 RepID=A0A8H7CK55_9AGAR|nr:hypothetical protein MVEN_01994900 [Mycena venus]
MHVVPLSFDDSAHIPSSSSSPRLQTRSLLALPPLSPLPFPPPQSISSPHSFRTPLSTSCLVPRSPITLFIHVLARRSLRPASFSRPISPSILCFSPPAPQYLRPHPHLHLATPSLNTRRTQRPFERFKQEHDKEIQLPISSPVASTGAPREELSAEGEASRAMCRIVFGLEWTFLRMY